jgi:putative aldouronate transport system permease protein
MFIYCLAIAFILFTEFSLGSGVMKASIMKFIKLLRKNKIYLIMLSPATLFFFLFSYVPMAGIVLAFENYNFRDRFLSPFVGFENFKFIFSYYNVLGIVRNTVLYNIAFIAVNAILQISSAVILSQLGGKLFKKTSQSFMFFPYFISWVVVGAFAYSLFNYDNGLINATLAQFGVAPVDFYNSPGLWPVIIVLLNAWKSLGYGTIVYLAAIMGIDQEMYEAASIDGANVFQKITKLTLPCLAPTFIIITLLSIGGIFRGNFDMFFQLVGNNPILLPTTDVIDTYVTRTLLYSSDVGMAAAAGLVQSAAGFAIILIVNNMVRLYDKNYALF